MTIHEKIIIKHFDGYCSPTFGVVERLLTFSMVEEDKQGPVDEPRPRVEGLHGRSDRRGAVQNLLQSGEKNYCRTYKINK